MPVTISGDSICAELLLPYAGDLAVFKPFSGMSSDGLQLWYSINHIHCDGETIDLISNR